MALAMPSGTAKKRGHEHHQDRTHPGRQDAGLPARRDGKLVKKSAFRRGSTIDQHVGEERRQRQDADHQDSTPSTRRRPRPSACGGG
jgi:hypothetical protein